MDDIGSLFLLCSIDAENNVGRDVSHGFIQHLCMCGEWNGVSPRSLNLTFFFKFLGGTKAVDNKTCAKIGGNCCN